MPANEALGTMKYKEKAYYEYQLSVSSNLIRSIALIIGLFNLLLIIPDTMNIPAPAKYLMIVERVVYSLITVSLFIFLRRIKTFSALSVIVSSFELGAAALFMHVFSMYPDPDFLIQAFGAFIIITAIFLVPNYLVNMLVLSAGTGAAFLLLAYLKGMEGTRFIAVAAYLFIVIILCTVFAYNSNRRKRREFSSQALLKKLCFTDPLTKIGNRIKLEEEAEKWISFCTRKRLELSLVLIDVDNLKMLNDEYGHLVGDAVLYELAQIIKSRIRRHDVFVRWGGDEFVLLLPDTGIEEARKLIERIRAAIQEKQFDTNVIVTCSFGIAAMKESLSLEQLIVMADEFMYHAKKQGKDTIGAVGFFEN
jgi:two-component system cell cycle response regulator